MIVLLLLVLAAGVNISQSAVDKNREIRFVDRSPVFLPKGEVLKWLSMGYRGLMADWLWINSVLYYGRRIVDHDNPYYVYMMEKGGPEDEFEAARNRAVRIDSASSISRELAHLLYQGESRGLVEYIYPMLDRVTTVDPHFIFPYLFGGLYVMMDTGEIGEARRLLEKGKRHNPKLWEFPFYLGWIAWMYENDLERTHSLLLEAVSMEGCPAYVGSILTGLSRDLQNVNIARMYLEGILQSTDNEEIRRQIQYILDRFDSQQIK